LDEIDTMLAAGQANGVVLNDALAKIGKTIPFSKINRLLDSRNDALVRGAAWLLSEHREAALYYSDKAHELFNSKCEVVRFSLCFIYFFVHSKLNLIQKSQYYQLLGDSDDWVRRKALGIFHAIGTAELEDDIGLLFEFNDWNAVYSATRSFINSNATVENTNFSELLLADSVKALCFQNKIDPDIEPTADLFSKAALNFFEDIKASGSGR